jgi:hypothetical protein
MLDGSQREDGQRRKGRFISWAASIVCGIILHGGGDLENSAMPAFRRSADDHHDKIVSMSKGPRLLAAASERGSSCMRSPAAVSALCAITYAVACTAW